LETIKYLWLLLILFWFSLLVVRLCLLILWWRIILSLLLVICLIFFDCIWDCCVYFWYFHLLEFQLSVFFCCLVGIAPINDGVDCLLIFDDFIQHDIELISSNLVWNSLLSQ
jgi:hypothetical protein